MAHPAPFHLLLVLASMLLFSISGRLSSQDNDQTAPLPEITIMEGRGVAPRGAPAVVVKAVEAANHIAGRPYKRGGGHGEIEDNGYDCSGTVSYVLIKAGLLEAPLSSGEYLAWGEEGAGKWITVYARSGHAFLVIGGQRFDTTDHLDIGPGWRANDRSNEGFQARHPAGL